MTKEARSPGHIVCEEKTTLETVNVCEMKSGQVFIRQGSPHMVVHLVSDIRMHTPLETVSIINLLTGSVWDVPRKDQVWLATDVKLTLKSSRTDRS